jgi:two-component system phosphate regulon response regulator OmpR
MKDDLAHILVIDDDTRIRELLRSYLRDNGYRVSVAANAQTAREKMTGLEFDLLVLDVMMPGESGVEFTQSLRDVTNNVPILMLSALSQSDDRIAGLASGSDDYLAKPFEPTELLLRIRNILKRHQPLSSLDEVTFGPCSFNLKRGELIRNEQPVRLTTRERDLLRMLAQHAGRPVARNHLAPPGSEDNDRSVDVLVNRLRGKIEDDPSQPAHLQTVRGAGYVLHVD